MTTQEPEQTPLEAFLMMPRGGVAPRCKRVKRDGTQCKKPSRAGYSICPSHGAGYPSREAAGERKKPGRPVEHGIYSIQPTRSFVECQAEVASLEDALTSSDRDLVALKGVQVMKLAELEAHGPKVEEVERILEALALEAEGMDFDNITPEEAMTFVRRLAALLKPAARLSKLVTEIADVSTKSIHAHRVRAETRARLSESEGVAVFLRLLGAQMRIVRGLSTDENAWRTYQMEVQRQILAPNRLEAPPLDLEHEGPG